MSFSKPHESCSACKRVKSGDFTLATDFFLISYSKPHFKWDFPQQGRYPYGRIKVYETRPAKKLVLKSLNAVKAAEGVVCDVAAVLLLDASNDDFVLETVKLLTTFNGYKE